MTTVIDDKLQTYKKLQIDMQQLVQQKSQAVSQLNENILVKGELDLLNEDSKVYKLVGPTLMSVELEEAKENISKRLQFIEAEVTNVEKAIDEKRAESDALGDEIAKLQQKMQAEAASAARQLQKEITDSS